MSFVWQVLLYSMHKYYARLVISEVKKNSNSKETQLPRVVYQEDFPETTFIAVTAYQNEEVHDLVTRWCSFIEFAGYPVEDH